MSVSLSSRPEHIPANLVRDIDPWQLLMSAGKDAHERASRFHQEFPGIFYVIKLGFLGGVLVPRLASDIRNVLQDFQTFSSQSYTAMSRAARSRTSGSSECDFNDAFALIYPIEIFLRLMGSSKRVAVGSETPRV